VAVKRRSIVARTQTELDQVIVAIDLYKEKIGSYPPDNPGLPALNQLYYELVGTSQIDAATLKPWTRAFDARDSVSRPLER